MNEPALTTPQQSLTASYAELLLALTLSALFWVLRCSESLWLDELQTYWVIKDGLGETVTRAFSTQGFTPLYYILMWDLRWYFSALVAHSEYILRLPSLIATFFATAALFAATERILNRRAAGVAVIMFVCLDDVIDASLFARPYALALAFSCLSLWFFLRWLTLGRKRDQYCYLISFLLSVYAHYFFAGALVVHVGYAALGNSERRLTFRQVLLTLMYILIGLVPLVPQVRLMLAKRDLMSIAPMPGISDLALSYLPLLSLIALILAGLGALAIVGKGGPILSTQTRPRPRLVAWLLLFLLLPASSLYVASLVLDTSVFVPRYFLWGAPAWALCCAYASHFIASRLFRDATLLLFVGFVIAAEFTKDRFQEDWRSAATAAAASLQTNPGGLLLYSGVVESARDDWVLDESRRGQFTAPLSYYTIPQDPLVLPLLVTQSSALGSYWADVVRPYLKQQTGLVLICLNNLSWSENGERRKVCDEIDKLLRVEHLEPTESTSFKRISLVHYSLRPK